MKREDFIKSLSLGMVMVCTGACLEACSKKDSATPTNPSGTGGGGNNSNTVSLDITTIPNIGDQTTKSGVLFIRIDAGTTNSAFVATEALCPHQGGNLVWLKSQNLIQCQLHFSEYQSNGSVIQGPQNTTGSTRALKIYSTALSGNTLTATVV